MTTLRPTNGCGQPRTILRVVALIATAILLSLNCRLIPAQEPQAGKPQKAADSRAEQLAHQIDAAELNLQKLREQIGTNDPRVAQAQKELEAFLALENRLLQLSQEEPNESTKAEIANVTDAIYKWSIEAQTKYLEKKPDQAAQAQQLQQMKDQLAEREKKMAALAKQMMDQRQPLPPLENGQLKVYALGAVPARAASQTIESLFGAQVLRIAVDERSNSLIVYGKSDTLAAVDVLLTRLGEQAVPAAGAEKAKQSATAPRSLLLRVFWLADGLPQGVGQTPTDFLPESVIQAATKLGLEAPRLVTQTVNSLALGREDAVEFSTNVPALLFEQPMGLTCQGRIKLVSDDRVRLEMSVHVGGPAVNCEIEGSLATPLGHYMVLGTANSVMAEDGRVWPAMGGDPGMAGPGRGEGGGFRPASPGQLGVAGRGANPAGPGGGQGGFAPPAGAAGPGGPGEASGPEAAPAPGKPKFNTSRFAFVVQVIDGQSYPAEKEKSGSK
jgi:hypothetical protein